MEEKSVEYIAILYLREQKMLPEGEHKKAALANHKKEALEILKGTGGLRPLVSEKSEEEFQESPVRKLIADWWWEANQS